MVSILLDKCSSLGRVSRCFLEVHSNGLADSRTERTVRASYVLATFTQSPQALIRHNMPAWHHHRWICFCRLLFADRTSEDAVIPIFVRDWYLDRQFLHGRPFCSLVLHHASHFRYLCQCSTATHVCHHTQWQIFRHGQRSAELAGEKVDQVRCVVQIIR